MVGLGLFELLLILVFGVGGTILWITMLIECGTKEPPGGNARIAWFLVILLTHFVGAAVYRLYRRPRRMIREGA